MQILTACCRELFLSGLCNIRVKHISVCTASLTSSEEILIMQITTYTQVGSFRINDDLFVAATSCSNHNDKCNC